jgi:hypothetical protein
MLAKRLHIILVFVFLFATNSFSQKKKVLNLPTYNSHWLHFGFSLGLNKANFQITPIKNLASVDTVLAILPTAQFGFNLGIVTDLRIHEYATLRFLPDLSFQERILNYTLVMPVGNSIDTVTFKKNIESTILDFPLNIKIRSKRLNNFACYLIGGGNYSFDLASQKDVINSNVPKDVIVKLKKNDWSLQGGFGIDFYLPYFKFSIEGKYQYGIKNLLVRDANIFADAIDKMSTRLFLISLHFEG